MNEQEEKVEVITPPTLINIDGKAAVLSEEGIELRPDLDNKEKITLELSGKPLPKDTEYILLGGFKKDEPEKEEIELAAKPLILEVPLWCGDLNVEKNPKVNVKITGFVSKSGETYLAHEMIEDEKSEWMKPHFGVSWPIDKKCLELLGLKK